MLWNTGTPHKTQKCILKELQLHCFCHILNRIPSVLSFPQYKLKINNSSRHQCHLDYNGNNEVCVISARVKIKPRQYDCTFSIPCGNHIHFAELTTDQGKVNYKYPLRGWVRQLLNAGKRSNKGFLIFRLLHHTDVIIGLRKDKPLTQKRKLLQRLQWASIHTLGREGECY